MTESIESLVIEHLRHIRGRVDQIASDMSDLKHRTSGLKTSMVSAAKTSTRATRVTSACRRTSPA